MEKTAKQFKEIDNLRKELRKRWIIDLGHQSDPIEDFDLDLTKSKQQQLNDLYELLYPEVV